MYEEVDIVGSRLGPQVHLQYAVHSAHHAGYWADTWRNWVQNGPALHNHWSGRTVLSDGIQTSVAPGRSGLCAVVRWRLRIIQDGSKLWSNYLRPVGGCSQLRLPTGNNYDITWSVYLCRGVRKNIPHFFCYNSVMPALISVKSGVRKVVVVTVCINCA